MVHECLKRGWGIAKAKEHDSGFKEPHGGDEGRFPLVFLSNANVVISPMDVKLGEQGRLFHVVDQFRDEWEWIGISDGMGVEVTVVLAGAKGSIFLWDKKEGRGLGRF